MSVLVDTSLWIEYFRIGNQIIEYQFKCFKMV